MKDTITIIKDRIKNILNQRNMKIYELAKLSDVSEACIRNWYSKRNYVPSLPSLINICNVLDINLSMLVMTEDEEYCPINNESKKLLIDWFSLDPDVRKSIVNIIHYINKDSNKDEIDKPNR